jgi:predicted DNA-binding transcriptional regulator
MPEKRPKISQEQPKGKLTPEEIKEMVEKYKKEHEGLLPEYFSLPGEEKEEEREYPEELLDYYQLKEQLKPIEQGFKNETLRKNMIEEILSNIQKGQKEGKMVYYAGKIFYGYSFLLSYPEFNEIKKTYPNEINQIEQGFKNETLRKNMIEEILSDIQEGQKEGYTRSARNAFSGYSSLLSYPEFNEIKKNYPNEINQIEQGFKNETLRKNMIEKTLSDIQEGQKEGKIVSAWNAFYSYSSLLSYPEFNEIKKNYPNEINQIEQGLKNETLRKNAIEEILSDIQKGQKEGYTVYAWYAFLGYSSLLSYLSHLYKIGQKKLAEMESQKAMHPEKKLPPMPEEKAF